jgi:hypothetical protein
VLADRYMQISNMGHLPAGIIDELLVTLREEIARLLAHKSGSVAPAAPTRPSTRVPGTIG